MNWSPLLFFFQNKDGKEEKNEDKTGYSVNNP